MKNVNKIIKLITILITQMYSADQKNSGHRIQKQWQPGLPVAIYV